MTVEQIVATFGGLNILGGLAVGAFVFMRLGKLTQEVKNQKDMHASVQKDIDRIKAHCPLCTEEK